MPNGRPKSYNDDLAAEICERIADGESLKAVCADDAMPARSTVYLWLRDESGFSDMYARAKEECADLIFDEIIEIADEARNDVYLDSDGNERTNTEVIQRSKLRVDARKWVAAKLRPKVYGDKIVNEHTGKDGGPIEMIERRIVRPQTTD